MANAIGPSVAQYTRTPLFSQAIFYNCTRFSYILALPIHLLNNRLNNPPANDRAMPPEYIALDARLVAWLNLSQRENARVLVRVRTSAMTLKCQSMSSRGVVCRLWYLVLDRVYHVLERRKVN